MNINIKIGSGFIWFVYIICEMVFITGITNLAALIVDPEPTLNGALAILFTIALVIFSIAQGSEVVGNYIRKRGGE